MAKDRRIEKANSENSEYPSISILDRCTWQPITSADASPARRLTRVVRTSDVVQQRAHCVDDVFRPDCQVYSLCRWQSSRVASHSKPRYACHYQVRSDGSGIGGQQRHFHLGESRAACAAVESGCQRSLTSRQAHCAHVHHPEQSCRSSKGQGEDSQGSEEQVRITD